MNLKRILVISFLLLVISTYQTNSGIIFSLLMKVLLLKGVLFMTMPLSIGAWVMGSGTGFFAGNMLGGYMMLRAANRYHNKEKVKWTTGGYGGGGHGAYGGDHHGWGGWPPHTFDESYSKGKYIGSAIHALVDHKSKIASALSKVKGMFGGWKSTGPPSPPYYKGWGWGQGGYGDGYHYTAHSKHRPVTTKHKFDPYGHLKSAAAAASYGTKGYGASSYGNNYHYGQSAPVPSYGDIEGEQDPANTYFTSAYKGPAHEYTGLLTDNELLSIQSAQEKSSSEDDEIFVQPTTLRPGVLPNPVLENYLEKRLQEEAAKQKNLEQQEEAKQLIQMLRKAYLKQLVDSLKEEEVVATSTENPRGSRSIIDKNDIIQRLLAYKKFPMEENTEKNAEGYYTSTESSTPQIRQNETETVTSTEKPNTTTVKTTPTSSSSTEEYYTSSSTSTEPSVDEMFEIYEDMNQVTSTEKSSHELDLEEILEMPAVWIKRNPSTSSFAQRVRREAEMTHETQKSDANHPKTESEKQVESFVQDIKKFFTLLTVLDQDRCLQKLVCDVHTNQKDVSTLTQYEQNILTTFRLMKALMPEEEEDSSTKYRRAAIIGETGQSLDLCQQTYSTCGYSSSQIISLGSQADSEVSASDWALAESASTGAARSEYVTMPKVRRSLRSFYL